MPAAPANLEHIPVGKLMVDLSVQRNLDSKKVERIAGEFDPDALGALTVSRRKGGLYVIDGQHRAAGARQAKGDDFPVPCQVFRGLSVEAEARMFRMLNNTTKVEALTLFRVRLVEGETSAVEVNRILEAAGWKLADKNLNRGLRCVAAMERIYRRDADALARALEVIVRAWGTDDPAGDARIVEGLGLLLARYGDAVDIGELASKLSASGTPSALLGRARTLRELTRSTVVGALAEVVVEVYNAKRRTRALPPWRS
jgi:hypothetical protein